MCLLDNIGGLVYELCLRLGFCQSDTQIIYYNITITVLLAAVALRIINVELFSLFADPFG